jgi:hypothetical protein
MKGFFSTFALSDFFRNPASYATDQGAGHNFAIRLGAILTFCLILIQSGYCQLHNGRVYTVPQKLYVNQQFEIFLELEISRGLDINNLHIQNFPNDPNYITLSTLEQERPRQNRRTKDGEVTDVLLFKASARCHKAVSHTFQPILSCEVVERRNRGFFSFSSSSMKSIRMEPFTLKIHALPQSGRPQKFSGAVGHFSLRVSASKIEVRPGDLITLKLELSGDGWLNNAEPPVPAVTEDFKSYPPKELLRSGNRLITEQIVIPNSTNAVVLPAVSFNYFDPAREQYARCSSQEIRLNFMSTAQVVNTNEVKVIATEADEKIAPGAAVTTNTREADEIMHKITPIVIGALTLMLASFVFLSIRRLHSTLAALLALLALLAGGSIAFKSNVRQDGAELHIRKRCEMRLAPSASSPAIITLPEGSRVTPLEKSRKWIRVKADNLAGWISSDFID